MTDQPNELTDEQATTPDTDTEGSPATAGDDHAEKTTDDAAALRREAAKYRRRLRETEAERDQAVARLSDAQRAEVERQITGQGGLQSAADFWTAGVKLDDLRGDDGGLDPEKIREARDKVLSEHPHWREKPTSMDGGVREPVGSSAPSFGAGMKKAAGQG